MESSEKLKICFLLLFAHILISIFTIIPGYLSIDEATYHVMAKNFSESGGFEIWNGYREYPSPELESQFIFARNGRLVSQYPYLYPVLCMPFYRIWGYHGMFFINVIAFIGIVALCYAIAQKIFNDRNMSLNSCLILALASCYLNTFHYGGLLCLHLLILRKNNSKCRFAGSGMWFYYRAFCGNSYGFHFCSSVFYYCFSFFGTTPSRACHCSLPWGPPKFINPQRHKLFKIRCVLTLFLWAFC